MSDFEEFDTATVVVRQLTGAGGLGEQYAAGQSVPGVQVDDARKLVRSSSGDQVVSESTIYDEDMTHAALYTPGSRVDLPSGRTASVIVCKTLDALGAELPAHLEVALT